MTDTVLVLAWLVFAHLVADFVLQNDWIALNKGTGGRGGWAALATHGLHVALCLLPAVFVFGLPGVVYVVVVGGSHVLVDRWKVRATRRAEAAALESARRRHALGDLPSSGLGNAWTPWPGMLFLADQFLHMTFALVGWLVILRGVGYLGGFVDAVNLVLRDWDRAEVHAVVLTVIVLLSLFLVNTRGAYYFVLSLASPRDVPPAPVRDPDAPAAAPLPTPRPALVSAMPSGASLRIAATTSAIERLLIVALVLTGNMAAAALVVLAEVLAHFRQLDDRRYLEYFLLATSGSVMVALFSGIVAQAALSTLGG